MNNADAWAVALDVVDAARSGRTSVLVIEADAGFGKTRMLRRLFAELGDFDVRRAFGEQDAPDVAFRTLGELLPNVPVVGALQAVGLLLDAVDELQRDRPVAFVIDDLQWADAESVRALSGVLRRVVGDRLLFVVATRPLGRQHPEFQRMLRDVDAVTIALEGLTVDEVSQLAGVEALAGALHQHTAGNPLHVMALLSEHSLDDLAVRADSDDLPAPLELAATMGGRLQRLAPEAAELLGALAVLGDGWVALDTAGAVADIADPRGAARVLGQEGLVRSRGGDVLVDVRIFHSVLRAAIYEVLPGATRRALHQRAAARVTDAGARLRHRVAAGGTPDQGLVADLVAYARGRHESRQFREAARFLRLAATVAESESARTALQLDADVEALLGRDPHAAREQLHSGDVRDRLVVALTLSMRGEWQAAWSVLGEIAPDDLAKVPDFIVYRVLAVRVHSAVGCGRPDDETLADIARAERLAPDPAFIRHVMFAKMHTWAWVMDELDYWRMSGLGQDRAELSATPQGRALLAWRGMVSAMDGSVEDAIGDLSTVTALVGAGGLDFTEGNYHALLGLAQYLAGDAARASASIDVSLSTGLPYTHPVTLAVSALREVLGGDAAAAREASATVRAVTLRSRYRGALFAADIVDVLVLAVTGTPESRAEWVRRRRFELGDARAESVRRAPALWIAVHGIAADWGVEPGEAVEWAARLDALAVAPPWRADMIAWLHARAGASRGVDVVDELGALARGGFADVPALRSLVEADAAASAPRDAAATARRPDAALDALSERERAVVALVADGMSYAQIAKELYISRSTVGFHLSNCYAKTDTRSRHELAELARSAGL